MEEDRQKKAVYVAHPDQVTYGEWQFALREVSLCRMERTQKSLLSMAQNIFEYCNRSGRLMAWLAKGQFAVISGVKDLRW